MDPVLKAFADNYGIFWAVVVIGGGSYVAALIRDRLIPYLVERQKAKNETAERLLKAFEDSARSNVQLAHAIQDVAKNQEQTAGVLSGVSTNVAIVAKNQEQTAGVLSGVATNVAILVSRKRQGVGGD